MKFYGQCGQDRFLESKIFKGMQNGYFVDVGAHDGLTINNSYYFEKNNKWQGICIEPIPSIFDKLEKNRDCICLNLAIDNKDGIADFYLNTGQTEMLSGLKAHYDPRHEERKNKAINKMGGDSNIVPIKTTKLSTILRDHNVTHVNYLSIDVEGGEMAVLESIDYNATFIDIIDFEANYPDTADQIVKYLENNNFKFLTKLGHDIIMINKDSCFL